MADAAPVAASGRRARWSRAFLGAAALGLVGLVAGNAWVLGTTSAAIAPSVAQAPARPVAIVLGNRVLPDGTPSRELTERVRVALELYRQKKVQTIFLSGSAHSDTGYDEPAAMADWLERRGVPRAAMILDGRGYRTAATMADAAARGLHDVLVCTHLYHLPRSLYLARHAGLNAMGVAAAPFDASVIDGAHSFVREGLARAETVVEVALRGVRGSSR